MSGSFVEFQVGTADLRRGLQAVAPHVQSDAKAQDTHRIRVEVGTDGEIVLLATDGFTAAAYSAAGTDVSCIGMDYFDLSPEDVIKILAVFKAGKDDDPDYPDSALRFHVTEKQLSVRDVSGLFEGHELDLPALPAGQWPNVARLFGENLQPSTADRSERARLELPGKYLERFGKSSRVIGSPLVIDTDKAVLIIGCGEVFAGVVNPGRISEDQQIIYTARRSSWARTLVQLGSAATARVQTDEADERLIAAVQFVGPRQVTTVRAIRDEFGLGQAEASALLDQMEREGLVGAAKRGKARPVLFAPDEVDQVVAKLRGESWLPVGATAPDGFAVTEAETVPAESVPDDVGDQGAITPTSWEADAETHSGRPDDPLPPAEFYDADAQINEALVPIVDTAPADPFSDRQGPPDPFMDSDGNAWPTIAADPFSGQ